MKQTNDLYVIERLEGRGLTAVVADPGCLYSTYDDFAKAAGYPEAVADFRSGRERGKSERGTRLLNQTVRILAKGKHGGLVHTTIYVVESADGERFLFGADGLKISENKTEGIGMGTIEARYERAVEQAREAIEELRLAALAKGYEDARRDLQGVAPTPRFTPITVQEHRDEIIEMAKRDVAELAKNGFARNKYGDKRVVKFIVDKDKRTVVVLLRGYLSGIVYEKGIAKCTPTDCFNVHIGKAIALRRALGLEVPAEYLNAPQPTEVRVGDLLEYSGLEGVVYQVLTKEDKAGNLRIISDKDASINIVGQTANGGDFSRAIIIDDTRDGANE